MAAIQPKPTQIRLLLDQDEWQTATKDLVTGAAVQLPNGADLLFNLMFFNSFNGAGAPLGLTDDTKLDFTHITSVVLALQDTSDPHNAETIWSYTVANANIHNSCTAANWNSGADQQVQVVVPAAANSFDMEAQSQSFWFLVYAVTDDAPAKMIPLAAWSVSTFDTGMPVINPVTQAAQVGYTSFLLGGLYYRVSVINSGGVMTLAVDQTGRTSP